MHRPYLKFPYTCSKPVPCSAFCLTWITFCRVTARSCAPVRSVCVKYARRHVHPSPRYMRGHVQQVRGPLCFPHGNARTYTHTYTQTGGIIYGEAAASRMMKGFQPLSPCPCVRMSHRPNHKIVIEVSDVATLSAIAVVVWQTRAVF